MAAPSTVSSTPRFFYGWAILPACFLISMAMSGASMAFGVFIPPLVQDMGWSHSALSFTYALSSMVTGVGVLVVGSLVHTRSLRLLLMWGGLINGLGVYMTSTVTTIEGFYFWYGGVAALGRSVFGFSTITLVTRWFEHRRGLATGLTKAGNGLGPFLFSPLVTWVIFWWDWQTAFVVTACGMTACILLSCLVIRNHPRDMGLQPYGTTPPRMPPPRIPAAGAPQPSRTASSMWGTVLRREGFWSLALINFFCCLCHSIPLVHIVGFAQTAGLSAFASAWVLAFMALSSVVGRIFWGMFADRHGTRFTLMLTLFVQGTLVLWLVNAQDPVIFFLYALLWGFGYGGVGTQYGMVAREVYGSRLFGPGYAGQSCLSMVGMAAGGFLGGYLFDLSHSYVSAWLVSFGAGLISALLAMDLVLQTDRAPVTPSATEAEAPSPVTTTSW
jgi:MFS family permease